MSSVLCDFWYHAELGPSVVGFDALLRERLGARAQAFVFRFPTLRALALWWFARDFDHVVPEWNRYGRRYCVLQAIAGGRKIVILECIDFANLHRATLRTRILKFLARRIVGPAMRRSVERIHMMSEWERAPFAALYGISVERISCIHWPLSYSPQREATGDDRSVFASGRACCDWPTLFAAARLGVWPLTVVCAGKDRAEVDALNADGRATVMSDIPLEEHDRRARGAAVIVISLEDRMTSAGQIRLGDAISAGVPVVATAISGLDEYLVDGLTGMAVPVGDPVAMAAAIEGLLADPGAARGLAERAQSYARPYTRAHYFERIAELLERLPDRSSATLPRRNREAGRGA